MESLFTTQYDGFTKGLSANAQLLWDKPIILTGNWKAQIIYLILLYFLKDFAIPPGFNDISELMNKGCQGDTVIYQGLRLELMFCLTFNGRLYNCYWTNLQLMKVVLMD